LSDKSIYARMGRLASIITILPGSMAAGWLVGYYLMDRYLTRYPWGSISLTLVGAAAGFYEIIRLLMSDRAGDDGH
jgi:F0F1-type ATP synthase assembly protein I